MNIRWCLTAKIVCSLLLVFLLTSNHDFGRLRAMQSQTQPAIIEFLRDSPLDYARFYEHQLEEKRRDGTLDQEEFRRLIERIAVNYTMGGKLKKAKGTFEKAIKQDPEYPMFYYYLACTYGEMGKMKEALQQLRAAHQRKKDTKLPDALRDSSFEKFANDRKFVEAVQEMQKP